MCVKCLTCHNEAQDRVFSRFELHLLEASLSDAVLNDSTLIGSMEKEKPIKGSGYDTALSITRDRVQALIKLRDKVKSLLT